MWTRNTIRAFVAILMTGLAFTGRINASADGEKLVGRAILPTSTVANGPQSGTAYQGQTLNQIALPFDQQPVGNISGVLRNDSTTWLILTGRGYQSAGQSADFFLRVYRVQITPCTNTCPNGDEGISVIDWWTLTDKSGKQLTGANFDPLGLARASDGSYWIGDRTGNSLLHFIDSGKPSNNGRTLTLAEAPIALGGAKLGGIAMLPDGKTLIAAQMNGQDVSFRAFNTATKQSTETKGYRLDDPNNTIGGVTAISSTQLLVIEIDKGQRDTAKYKKVFQVALNNGAKIPLIDLLNVADPSNIGNQPVFGPSAQGVGVGGGIFKMPYLDISSVAVFDASTVIVVNNNHVPFNTGRSGNLAEDSDFAFIGLKAPLPIGG
jgi:glycerophosphoryl diester phosphodiesterase